jgi:SAM-dependent methyltransferase
MINTISLDLGCGKSPRNPFNCCSVLGIDVDVRLLSEKIKIADLSVEQIPFESDQFDIVTAFDFLEHIPRVIYFEGKRLNPFVEVMNEISRVLKPGGVFFSSTPVYPHPATFQDPTHVNFITEKTFINYFSVSHNCYAKMYGYTGSLVFMGQYIHNSSHLRATLRKHYDDTNETRSIFSNNDILQQHESITGKLKSLFGI